MRHSEVGQIKQLLKDTEPRWQGHIFCLRKSQPTKCHWVCLTPNLYIDDVHCMKTKDYNLASAILHCLERPEKDFGKEYSTTTTRVRKKDFIQLATYLEKSNTKNCAHECKSNKVDNCINNVSAAALCQGTASKKSGEGECKWKHNSLQPQKQTTTSSGLHQRCNKNGKHRNGKRRRKAKTERNTTHDKSTCLFAPTQDKKAEAKEGG